MAFPFVSGNHHFVVVGVATHFMLDLFGNVRGLALFFPYPEEYDVPVGLSVDSKWAGIVTLGVTAFELSIYYAIVVAPPVIPQPWVTGLLAL